MVTKVTMATVTAAPIAYIVLLYICFSLFTALLCWFVVTLGIGVYP